MKGIRSAVVALALTAAFAGTAAAQARPDVFTLVGPGSAIGVTVREVNQADAEKSKLAQPGGVYVESVRESSPAEKAGFRAGDIVVDFDGERVRGVRQFTRLVQDTPPQREVSAVVVRGTQRQTLKVAPEASSDFRATLPELRSRIERLPRDFTLNIEPRLREALPRLQTRLDRPTLGVTVTSVGDQLAQYFGVKQGALVNSVVADSAAAAAGLKAGDVITQVNGRPVSDASDVSEAFRSAEPGAAVEIRIVRDKKEMTMKATRPAAAAPPAAPRGIRFDGAGVRL